MLPVNVESYQLKDEYEILIKQSVHALICVLIE